MTTCSGKKYRFLELRHLLKEKILSLRIALTSGKLNKPEGEKALHIAMIDGRTMHGGMCDRFKGIISLYAYCKFHNLPFRVLYNHPFRLEKILAPNEYDWILKEKEYSDNPLFIRILYMRKEYKARRLLCLKSKRQIHFYTNRDMLPVLNESFKEGDKDFQPYDWGELFKELFKPGEELERRIESLKSHIGKEYIAAVFRFQNLLGDFPEYHFKALDSEESREKLIAKCMDELARIISLHPATPVLVTSDSRRFLDRVAGIEGVHVIPGELRHIDMNKPDENGNPDESHMKSFTDFYMLASAQKIYRIGTSEMYPSEFPLYASKIHNIPFESIEI